ncbi:MFS transporter [Anoxybacillus salavatliensis]|uniref:MFS transporter n=1 Tax=Anoxybacillus gonensis TaxID=198467 RepID=UPI00214C593B|nr:MFS transporter [Anoxybacillus gonensis]MCQ5365007.1 MFS transporter [Anoxybacillus gonensis]
MSSKGKILFGLSIAAFLGPFTQTIYTPSLSEIKHFFAVNQLMVNFTISLYTIILACSQFLIGPLTDTRGRKAVLLPGLLFFIFGSLICFVSTNYYAFLLGRALQAFGISTGSIVAAAVIGDIYTPKERGSAMSIYQTMVFLGPVLGPLLGSFIAAYFHWQWAFITLAFAGLLSYIYNRCILHETLPKDITRSKIHLQTFKGIFFNQAAFSIMFLGFFQFYGYYIFLVFLPDLLDKLFHISLAAKGLFFIPLTAGIVLGTFLGGKVQKRFTRKTILVYTSYVIALVVFAFGVCLMFNVLTMPVLILFLSAYGILLGTSLPSQSTTLVNLFVKEKGTAMGIYNFTRFTGAAIGPMLGALIHEIGSDVTLYLSLFIFLLAAAFFIHKNMYDPFETPMQVSQT